MPPSPSPLDRRALPHRSGLASRYSCTRRSELDRWSVPSRQATEYETSVAIEFSSVYDTARLARLYQALPEVIRVDGFGPGEIGSSHLCASRSGDHFEYVFDR